MRHLEPDDRHANAPAGDGLLLRPCDPFGESHHAAELRVVDGEEVIHLFFRNDQRVPRSYGMDVEKGEELAVLRDLVAGYLARHDFAEYSCHDA